jgi:DNA-binding PadR family transcriptional regulator
MNRPVPDEVVLGLLKFQPMHGYELLERFKSKDQLGRIWTMSSSQIYAVLSRLKKDGSIIGDEIEEPDVPVKTVYSITNRGQKKIINWLYDPKPSSSIHLIRVLFISRIYIASLLGYKKDEILAYQRTTCAMQLRKTKREFDECSSAIGKLTIKYIIGQLQTVITWLDENRSELLN